MSETASTFCPLPWLMTAVRNNGDMRICCQANTSESQGLLKKDNGEVFNARKDSILESRNSQTIKDIRREMLSNIDPAACVRCTREEKNGIRSRRIFERKRSETYFTIEDAKAATKDDGEIDISKTPLMYLDLRLGNFCNIKCRMCGPTDSSSWYDDYVKLWDTTKYQDTGTEVELIRNPNQKYQPIQNIYNWPEELNFWEDAKFFAGHLTYIHTVGGEPLLIEKQFEFLKFLIDGGYSKNIVLEYNTNGTIIPEKAWSLWKNFKTVKIGLSIDGVGDVNDYIRYPSKWDVVEKNIRRLDEAEGDFHLWFTFTAQALNILHIPEFLKWVIKSNFKRFGRSSSQPLVTMHPLHNPPHYNIKVFPSKIKEEISKKLREEYKWLDKFILEKGLVGEEADHLRRGFEKNIEGYISFMNDGDLSQVFEKFLQVTNKLDEIRGESFSETFPELSDLIFRNQSKHNEEES